MRVNLSESKIMFNKKIINHIFSWLLIWKRHDIFGFLGFSYEKTIKL